MKKLKAENQTIKKKNRTLEDHMEDEVNRLVSPIKEEMTRLYAQLQQSALDREEDRRDLAVLWPSQCLMPSLLVKYKVSQPITSSSWAAPSGLEGLLIPCMYAPPQPLNEDEKHERIAIAKAADAEIALREEIQAKAYEASRWSVQYDGYGRPYYVHADTGIYMRHSIDKTPVRA